MSCLGPSLRARFLPGRAFFLALKIVTAAAAEFGSAALPLTGFLSKQRAPISVNTEAETSHASTIYIGTARGTQCDRDCPFLCRRLSGRGQLSGARSSAVRVADS